MTATSFRLKTRGDQIFAYRGTSVDPTFLYGLSYDFTLWNGSAVESSEETALPDQLQNGYNAVCRHLMYDLHHVVEVAMYAESGVYNGITCGEVDDLMHEISNPSNWLIGIKTTT